MFSVVIGILVAITILLLALARAVAGRTQVVDVYKDPMYWRACRKTSSRMHRRRSPARTIQPGDQGAGRCGSGSCRSAAEERCRAVQGGMQYLSWHRPRLEHPRQATRRPGRPRIAEGKATLYQHALNGFTGNSGMMPAKGGRTDLPDALVKQGVDYMVSLATVSARLVELGPAAIGAAAGSARRWRFDPAHCPQDRQWCGPPPASDALPRPTVRAAGWRVGSNRCDAHGRAQQGLQLRHSTERALSAPDAHEAPRAKPPAPARPGSGLMAAPDRSTTAGSGGRRCHART